jgi:hypothetical protein
MDIKYFKLIGLVSLFFLSSCSLQKRLYNKGFYVSKTHSLKKNEQKTNTDTSATLLSIMKPTDVKEQNKKPTIVAVNNNNLSVGFLLPNTKLIADCDTLVLTNGTKILIKVHEVTPEQIKFRFCNAPEEPIRTLNKKDINYIVYANGYKEVVEQKSNEITPHYQQPDKIKTNGFAIAGFVLSLVNILLSFILLLIALFSLSGGLINYFLLFSPFVLPLLTIIFCVAALIQIYKSKGTQKGNPLAIIGLILTILLFAFLLKIMIPNI